jgi:hypothetical protein
MSLVERVNSGRPWRSSKNVNGSTRGQVGVSYNLIYDLIYGDLLLWLGARELPSGIEPIVDSSLIANHVQ